ncbi:MAG: SufS family cysteine desulfurase [Candidatus Nanopelagicales bacterium]
MSLVSQKVALDVMSIRRDFPILQVKVRNEKPLIYLDSAATSQKPEQVITAEANFYRELNSGVHRGAHYLSELATDAYEQARARVAGFVGAKPEELVITKNATESLNLLAYAFSNQNSPLLLKAGDEILITEMEHHANLVPWQQVAEKTGATLRWIPITESGELSYESVEQLITEKTKVVSVTQMSNVLGTINDLDFLAERARAVGAKFFVDACQSVPHMKIDFAKMNADAIAFSAHKMLGPLGIGVLIAREELLDQMPPFLTGGSMIETVAMDKSTFAKAPKKFEAGTPNAAGIVATAAAVNYLENIGMEQIREHEKELTDYLLKGLAQISSVKVFAAEVAQRGSAVSFAVDQVHPHDVGQVLDDDGIAIRVGHHCAWPLMKKLNVHATSRISTYLYNDKHEIDKFLTSLERVKSFFGVK